MAVTEEDIESDIEQIELSEVTVTEQPVTEDLTTPTNEEFLAAFEESSFAQDPKFTCPILKEIMYDAVLVSSGQIYSREGITQYINNALTSNAPLNCPVTKKQLLRMSSEQTSNRSVYIDSFMVSSFLLKDLIRDAIHNFKNSDEGKKYKELKFDPTEKIHPIEVPPAPANPATLLLQNEQDRPYNRNRFFTENCVDMSNTLNVLCSILTSAGSVSAVDTALPGACCTCPKCALVTISGPLTCMLTTLLCLGVTVGPAECEKRFCLEETSGSAAESLMMHEGNDEENPDVLSENSSGFPPSPNVAMNENNLPEISVELSNVPPNMLTMEEDTVSTTQTTAQFRV